MKRRNNITIVWHKKVSRPIASLLQVGKAILGALWMNVQTLLEKTYQDQ
jgi:hypothetical protein